MGVPDGGLLGGPWVDWDNLYNRGLDDDGCTMEDSGDAGLIENASQEALTSRPSRRFAPMTEREPRWCWIGNKEQGAAVGDLPRPSCGKNLGFLFCVLL